MGRLEGVARSRPVRVALIVSLATFGGWSFAPYVMGDVSTRAAVNAPVIRLTAVVEGTVPELPAVGSYFAAPARVTVVTPSEDTGEVAQFRAEAIRAGGKARVRLIGADEWQPGRIARVAGAAAQRSDTLFAAKGSSLPDDREISVEVLLDTPAHGSPERRCDVGRLAEVRFG